MPVEPNATWYVIGVIACGIVAIGAVWFTRWVIDRLDKDRSKLHDHAGKIQIHELRIEEHEDAIKDLKGRRK